MKIKTKLTLGVGLLFILIILLSIVGAFNINVGYRKYFKSQLQLTTIL